MLDQKKRTLKRLGIAGVATAMTTMGIPGIAGAATVRVAPDATSAAAAATTPGAPSNLTAVDAGAGQITLSWTAPTSGTVSGYNIYEGTAPGAESTNPENGLVLVQGTKDTVTVSNDGTYYFEVAAVNAAGQGQVSNEAVATAAAIKNSAPSGVTATPSAGAVTVSWNVPSTGDVPLYYTVNYGTSASSLTQSVQVDVTDPKTGSPTMAYINKLTDGTTYYFDVTATNAAGTSPASSTVSAVPKTGLVPPPPQDVTVTPNNGSITITWNELNAASNSVTGYDVYEGTSSGGESSTPVNGTTTITGESTTVTVPNGTTEYFVVKAVNSVGMSAASDEVHAAASTSPSAGPTSPQFLVANPLDGAAKLTWTAPTSSGDSQITSYTVLEGTSATTITTHANVSATGSDTTSGGATSAYVTGLTNGTPYYFEVEATNAAGHPGSFSNVVHTTPGGNSVPTAPSGLTVTTSPATTATVNKLTWTHPFYAGTGTDEYDVYRNGTLIAQTTTDSFTDSKSATGVVSGYTPPSPNVKYSYKVTAFNNYGQSPADGPVSITTGDVTPAAPTLDGATVPTNGSVTLTWSAPADQGAGKLLYEVLENGQPDGSYPAGTAGTPETVTGVSTTQPATFTVEAESTSASTVATILGTSVPSNGLTVTAKATPNTPTGLSAVANGPTSVKLTWGAPTGAANPTNYEIYQGISSSSLAPVGQIDSSTSFTATSLTSNVPYYFEVQAVNLNDSTPATDASALSNEVSATPILSTTVVPGTPSGLHASVEGQTVNLGWTAPTSSGGSPLMNYEIFERPVGGGSNPTLIGSTSGTGTSAVLDNLDASNLSFQLPSVPVDLYVKAVNSSGQTSALSAPVEVTPSSIVKPTAPGTPTVSVNGPGQVLVVWSPPENTGGSAITGYFVTAHLVNGKGKTIRTSGSSTEATIGGLAPGRYYFTVVGINRVGSGTPSAPSAIIAVSSVSVATKVYVTPPAMLNAPGTAMIRVTVNSPTARVQLFDEANGKNFFFSKAIKETTPSKYGNGVAEFLVNIDATNHFYVMVNGVKSNVVTAMVK
jgi:hypothetical protein